MARKFFKYIKIKKKRKEKIYEFFELLVGEERGICLSCIDSDTLSLRLLSIARKL